MKKTHNILLFFTLAILFHPLYQTHAAILVQKIVPNGSYCDGAQSFGNAIDMVGGKLVVGMPLYSQSFSSSHEGSVFLYERNASANPQWTERASYSSSEINDRMGGFVAISEDWMVASCGGSNKLVIDSLTTQATVFPDFEGQAPGMVGTPVALDENRMVIGATADQKVYVYERNGTDWTSQATIATPEEYTTALTISAGHGLIVLGSGENNKVWIYEQGSRGWTLTQTLTSPDEDTSAFGTSVDYDGTTLVIGASASAVDGTDKAGVAYSYVKNSNGLFAYSQKLAPQQATANANFGISVSVDNDFLAVGSNKLGVFVYQKNGQNWTFIENIQPDTENEISLFGSRISLSGNLLAIADTDAASDCGSNTGAVYIYETTKNVSDELINIYRFTNKGCGSYFFTNSTADVDFILDHLENIYDYDGAQFTCYTAPINGTSPLYRFYSKYEGTHFYTAEEGEKNFVMNDLGEFYDYEGVMCYVDKESDEYNIPVYRFYHDAQPQFHVYTQSEIEEQQWMSAPDSIYEGIGFYAWPVPVEVKAFSIAPVTDCPVSQLISFTPFTVEYETESSNTAYVTLSETPDEYQAAFRYKLPRSDWSVWTVDAASVLDQTEIEVRLMSSGEHSVTRSAAISVGDESATFSATTENAPVPDTPPNAPVLTSLGNLEGCTNADPVTLLLTAVYDAAQYRYSVDNGNWFETTNTGISLSALAEGGHEVNYQAGNAAGWSGTSPGLSFIVDRTPIPQSAITETHSGAFTTGDTKTITVTSSETVWNAQAGVTTGTGTASVTSDTSGGVTSFTVQAEATASGDFTVRVTVQDRAGNTTNKDFTFSVSPDHGVPATPKEAPVLYAHGNSAGCTNADPIMIILPTISDATIYRYSLNSGAWTETANTVLDLGGLADGSTCTLTYQAGNSAGWSADSPSLSFTIDRTPIPADAITESHTGNFVENESKDITIRVLELVWKASASVTSGSATASVVSGGSAAELSFIVRATPTASGDFTVTVSVEDKARNVTTKNFNFSAEDDLNPKNAPVLASTGNQAGCTNADPVLITLGTITRATKYRYRAKTTDGWTETATTSLSLALAEGDYVFQYQAGNDEKWSESSPALNLTVDRTPIAADAITESHDRYVVNNQSKNLSFNVTDTVWNAQASLISGSGTVSVPTNTSSGVTSFTVLSEPTASGVFKFSVSMEDRAGNPTTKEYTLMIVSKPITEWTEPITGMVFVWVPGGSCRMTDKDDYNKSFISTVDGFWMSKYEVTQAQWHTIMGGTPEQENKPMKGLAWTRISETEDGSFASKLNALASQTFRLPTESEWEYACRAGTTTDYYWGDDTADPDAFAWYWDNSGDPPYDSRATHTVGQRQPNQFGLYDMSGNVAEWVHDYYTHYPSQPQTNYTGPNNPDGMYGQRRVYRGGNFKQSVDNVSSGIRNRQNQFDSLNDGGFRLVIDPSSVQPEWTEPTTGMTFVWVPEQTFYMGQENGETVANAPQHTVAVDGFWMGKYEVTQAQWQTVMGDNPSTSTIAEDHPVETVSWNQVSETVDTSYASRLNALTGYSFRLPTEAEWECAYRGGIYDEKYYWIGWTGNTDTDIKNYVWFDGNSDGATNPVGLKKPNPYGLYDMGGNVAEWVHDWYGAYSGYGSVNPTGPASGTYKVLRGGGWDNGGDHVRAARREYDTPDTARSDLGFRLILPSSTGGAFTTQLVVQDWKDDQEPSLRDHNYGVAEFYLNCNLPLASISEISFPNGGSATLTINSVDSSQIIVTDVITPDAASMVIQFDSAAMNGSSLDDKQVSVDLTL